MTHEKEIKPIKTIDLTAFTQLDGAEETSGYVCDVETGICGPVTTENKEKTEESKHENNSLV